MADLTLDPGIKLTELTIDNWGPGQSDVIAPYRPALEASGPAATGWQGTVGLKPVMANRFANDAKMLALKARLRGNRHRLRLALPRAYRGATPPPSGARLFMTDAIVDAETLLVTYTPQNLGDWLPSPDSYCNIGDRLYFIDSVDGPNNRLRLLPPVVPLEEARKTGIHPTPGGGAPDTGLASNLQLGQGMGTFRGSLYEAYLGLDRSHVFWTNPLTGTRREVLVFPGNVDSMGSLGDSLYASIRPVTGTSLVIQRLHIDLADSNRNRAETVLTLTSPPGDRIAGMAQWSAPGSRDVHLYLAIRGETSIYRSSQPLPARVETATFASYFTALSAPTVSTNVLGLSPGPRPGDPLFILDGGGNAIYTWNGVTRSTFASGEVGAPAGANVIRVTDCHSIEWYRGQLLVHNIPRGTTGAGLARVNYDVPAGVPRVRFATPFVMARLQVGPTVGPVGAQFPSTTFRWIEVPTQP